MSDDKLNTSLLAPPLYLTSQFLALVVNLIHHGYNLLFIRGNKVWLSVVDGPVDGNSCGLVFDVVVVCLDHEIHDCRELVWEPLYQEYVSIYFIKGRGV